MSVVEEATNVAVTVLFIIISSLGAPLSMQLQISRRTSQTHTVLNCESALAKYLPTWINKTKKTIHTPMAARIQLCS